MTWLSPGEMWMSALNARNNVAHAYNKSIALDIIDGAKNKYYKMFEELKETIEKEWL